MSKVKLNQLLKESDPGQIAACRAFARMMNNLDFSHLEPWLAEDLVVMSQVVMTDMTSKEEYTNYITGKLMTVKKSGSRVWAQLAYRGEPCVVLAQEAKDNKIGTVFFKMSGNKIASFCMCIVPAPQECLLSDEYPL